jgi:hypothetical protein
VSPKGKGASVVSGNEAFRSGAVPVEVRIPARPRQERSRGLARHEHRKPKHAGGNPRAYSARGLCHAVLVPLAAELRFSLGVSGREPLNNQPYFRMTRLGDNTPIRETGRPAFNHLKKLVDELSAMREERQAREALRAFIAVRRGYQRTYAPDDGEVSITPAGLVDAIARLVAAASEGGRRAQAAAAGLLDVFAGPDRVETARINDPSRHHPGDVAVRFAEEAAGWEKVFEVRDKPVSASDVMIFGRACVDKQVPEAAVVMVAADQPPLNREELSAWACGFGLGLTLFFGWRDFTEQVLFWSGQPQQAAARAAVECIGQRLREVEVSDGAVELWQSLTRIAEK